MIAGLALAVAAAGAAADGPVELDWRAPPDCPDAASVRARIDARVPSATATATAKVRGDVLRLAPDRFSLVVTIELRQGSARRAVFVSSCEAAANTTAALVAVMLDPTAVGPPQPRQAADDGPPKPPPRRYRVRGIVGILGTGSFGALPRFGGGLLATAGIDTRYVRAEAVTTYEAPQLRLFDDQGGAGAVFDLWTVGARGCGVARVHPLVVPVCAGVEVGRLRARGEGLDASQRVRLTHARATVGAGLAWAATRWLEVRADVAGLITLTPWRVVIDDLGELHRSRPVGVRMGLGFAALFP